MTILSDVKDALLLPETNGFDSQIMSHISMALLDVTQATDIVDIFPLTMESEWPVSARAEVAECAKAYVVQKVGLLFDPPANSFVVASKEKFMLELLWRIKSASESGIENV